MESQFFHSVAGQEVQEDDLNSVSENAAIGDDRLLAELLRLLPYDGSSVAKGVLPYGFGAPGTASPEPTKGLVASSGSADAAVFVQPFRAIVGSRTALATDAKENLRDIRSTLIVGSTTLHQSLTLLPTSANHRWTLVYARVDVDQDQAAVTRYVKDPTTEVIAAQSIAVRKATTVTIGMINGVEGATPARPAVPVDSATQFNIPLAYIFVPHPFTGGSTVLETQIHEAAPCRPIAEAMGASHLAPANHLHKVGGTLLSALDFGFSVIPTRPGGYLPSTLVGGASRLIPMGWTGDYDTGNTLNAITVVDDSIDWRNRMFKWQAHFTATGHFAWMPGIVSNDRVPSATGITAANLGAVYGMGFGQSFFNDAAAWNGGVAGGIAVRLNPNVLSGMAASSDVILFARDSDGALCAWCASTNPNGRLFVWLEASGPFPNAAGT